MWLRYKPMSAVQQSYTTGGWGQTSQQAGQTTNVDVTKIKIGKKLQLQLHIAQASVHKWSAVKRRDYEGQWCFGRSKDTRWRQKKGRNAANELAFWHTYGELYKKCSKDTTQFTTQSVERKKYSDQLLRKKKRLCRQYGRGYRTRWCRRGQNEDRCT